MDIVKTANATWRGGLKEGRGILNTESGVLSEAAYGFNTRFEGVTGTNPEELIGAAHAGCFSMAFSKTLEEAGFTVDTITTEASVHLKKADAGFHIPSIDLTVRARVAKIENHKFQELAEKVKANCPVSKVLNAKINMTATLF